VTVWLALGVALTVACVLLVARPFLREPATRHDRLDEPGRREQKRIALAEERDRALAALKELEFDHRTGKISDDDYRALVGPLRRRAAEALRALEQQTLAGRSARLTAPKEEGRMVELPEPVPEPYPPATEPPGPTPIPEPVPEPSEPPAPVPIPEPSPEPSPPPGPQ
jgi:outer membrane biosynthesis protein TonB